METGQEDEICPKSQGTDGQPTKGRRCESGAEQELSVLRCSRDEQGPGDKGKDPRDRRDRGGKMMTSFLKMVVLSNFKGPVLLRKERDFSRFGNTSPMQRQNPGHCKDNNGREEKPRLSSRRSH